VHSAGRHRAVIVHTATGRHLAELQAKFADVGFSGAATNPNESVREAAGLEPDGG